MVNGDSEPILSIKGLRKAFGTHLALRGVSFDLGSRERLAFLGPNGAGKTTLIRCLAGRTRPDSGSILVRGRRIDQRRGRDQLGLVPQEIALYGDLTTRENLVAFGRFHGLRGTALRERVDWALHWTGLGERRHQTVAGFSGGMKRRVNLACGVLHQPPILLLDEPTVGVDPQSREKLFSMLDELHQAGTSILLTTHHLDEAEQRSDRIVILDQGQVVADGTLDQLVRDSVGDSRWVRLRIDRPLQHPLPWRTAAGESPVLSATVGIRGDTVVSTRIANVSIQLPMLLDTVRHSGYEISDIEVHSPSLHHVFLHLTGHELRDGAAR